MTTRRVERRGARIEQNRRKTINGAQAERSGAA
jgi:hypothetical protein